MSDSYKSTQRQIAYERSRSKPEDVGSRNFAQGFLVFFLGFIAKLRSFFGKHKREVKRTHARGFTRGSGFGKHHRLGPISSPPVEGFSSIENRQSTRRAHQKLRKYAARGYGYVTPEREVEVIGKGIKNAKKGYALPSKAKV
jgi:hypothetical protein